MSKQIINIGSSPDDGTGDPLRDAFDKANDNFDELYQSIEDLRATGLTGQAYAVWSGTGLIFDVIWPVYYIDSVRYAAGSAQVTLDAADGTNPRLDVIALDATGAIKITGTPAADPAKPTVDNQTQLEITTVLVAAGATTPSGITDEVVYQENIEWTGSSNNGTVDFNSTTTPFAGTKCVNCGAFTNGQYIQFVSSAVKSAGDYGIIKLYLRQNGVWAAGTKLRVRLKNGVDTISIAASVKIEDGKYGFAMNFIGWQLITIPMSEFVLSGSAFDTLYFETEGSNALGFKLDNISFQTGSAFVSELQNAITSISTPSGSANADGPNNTITFAAGGSEMEISASGKTVTLGVKNASETQHGIVEEATDAEVLAGTETGGTGAKLFVGASKLITWWAAIRAAATTFALSLKAKNIAGDYGTLTDAATIAWNANTIGNTAQVTLGGNRTLGAITNPLTGGQYTIRVIQDGTGSRTLAFNAAYTFPNGVTPVLNSQIGGETLFSFVYDGTNFRYILPSGASRFTDVYNENQKASSGKKNPLHIDDVGKVNKTSFIEVDTVNQKTTHTAVDDTNTFAEWLNLSLQSILKIKANREVEFGGTTGFWAVLSGIASGLAGLIMNTNLANAWYFGDGLSTIMYFRTTTGDKATVFAMKYEQNSNLNFVNRVQQYNASIPGTAGTAYLVASVPIATGQFYEIVVLHARARTAGNKINSCNVFKTVGWNDAGTLLARGTTETIVPLRFTATTGGWSVVLDNATQSYQLWYTAETGVTSATECDVQLSISLR